MKFRSLSPVILAITIMYGFKLPSFKASPGVDLKIVSVTADPSEPIIFQPVTVTVTVENNGGEASAPCKLELRWSCCESIQKDVDLIEPGGLIRITLEEFLRFTDAGRYDIIATIDPENVNSDPNTIDNTISTRINVKLEVESLVYPASEWFEEPSIIPIPWEENSLMAIGRRKVEGDYYRDEEGRLLRKLEAKPWDSANFPENQPPNPDFDMKVDGLIVEITDNPRMTRK